MVIVTDKPKTSRAVDHVPVDISELADLVRIEKGLTEDINQATAHRTRIRAKIQALMGDGTLAVVNGVGQYYYTYKNSWATSKLLDEHRPLCEPFIKDVLAKEFDVKAFAKAHPDIARLFQTREFRAVSGDVEA